MRFSKKRVRGPNLGATIRIAATAFVLFMIVATIVPIGSQRASAADCPDGQIKNQQGQCVPKINLGGDDGSRILNPDLIMTPTQAPVIDNPPVIDVDVTPEPTYVLDDRNPPIDSSDLPPLVDVSPDAAQPASLVIGKYDCPAGYDPTGKSQYDLSFDCPNGLNGVTFLLSDGN